jgi:hypothetical protein
MTLDPDNGIFPFTCVAWDHQSPRPRFATGSADGTAVIWTSEPEHQQGSNETILPTPIVLDNINDSPEATEFSTPEATAVRNETGQGTFLDASNDRSMETRDPGGSQARELESRRESRD